MLVRFEYAHINPANIDYVYMPSGCNTRIRIVFSDKSYLDFNYVSVSRAAEKYIELIDLVNRNS